MKFQIDKQMKCYYCIIIYICLFIALVAYDLIPTKFIDIFNTTIGKIISLAIIIYIGTFNLPMALITAFIFLLLVVKSSSNQEKEAFENSNGDFYLSDWERGKFNPQMDGQGMKNDNNKKYESNEFNSMDDFGPMFSDDKKDDTRGTQWCVPASTFPSKQCEPPFQTSANDRNWCAINKGGEGSGEVLCIQKCPPKTCMPRLDDGKGGSSGCPMPGMQVSYDNPNYCCWPDKDENGNSSGQCSCDPCADHPECPKQTTCEGICPEVEEEEIDCEIIQICAPKRPPPKEEEETVEEECVCVPCAPCEVPKRDYKGELPKNRRHSRIAADNVDPTDPFIKTTNRAMFRRQNPSKLAYDPKYDVFFSD